MGIPDPAGETIGTLDQATKQFVDSSQPFEGAADGFVQDTKANGEMEGISSEERLRYFEKLELMRPLNNEELAGRRDAQKRKKAADTRRLYLEKANLAKAVKRGG